jgi:hypothetical protein
LARVEAVLDIDHGQFYIQDDVSQSAHAVWDGGALERHVGAVQGLVAVGAPQSRGLTRVILDVADREPGVPDNADHVVEISVSLAGPIVWLSECLGRERIVGVSVQPGWHRCRISAFDLAIQEEEFDGGLWQCQLWPAPEQEPTVLTCWGPWRPRTQDEVPNPFGLRVMVGAEAWDARLQMTPVGKRGGSGGLYRFLFRDADGAYWEYGGDHGTDLIELPASEVQYFVD